MPWDIVINFVFQKQVVYGIKSAANVVKKQSFQCVNVGENGRREGWDTREESAKAIVCNA